MSTSYRNAPVLSDSSQYESWVKEVRLWQICCKLEKKEQGPALALSLTDNAREAALELAIEDLNADDGVEKLIVKLNGLFLKDENQRIYVALKTFEQYQRPKTQSVDCYINEFERLHNKLKAYGIVLPDAVIAYRLLESANLESAKAELIRTTIQKLEYKEMKAQLRKLEDVAISSCSSNQSDTKVKEEPADTLFNKSNKSRGFQRGGRTRGYTRGRNFRGDSFRGSSRTGNEDQKKTVTFKKGSCYICKSIYHWASDCPHKDQQAYVSNGSDTEDVNITL